MILRATAQFTPRGNAGEFIRTVIEPGAMAPGEDVGRIILA